MYIDRLIQRNNFVLSELNIHRVVITSVMIAAKFFDDLYFNNAFYARVGGIPTKELNELEVDFLLRVNFSLRVAPDEFERYNRELLAHATGVAPVDLHEDGASSIPIASSSSSSSSNSSRSSPIDVTSGEVVPPTEQAAGREPPPPQQQQQQPEQPPPPPQPQPQHSPPRDGNDGNNSDATTGKMDDSEEKEASFVVVAGSSNSNTAPQPPKGSGNGDDSWPVWSTLLPVR